MVTCHPGRYVNTYRLYRQVQFIHTGSIAKSNLYMAERLIWWVERDFLHGQNIDFPITVFVENRLIVVTKTCGIHHFISELPGVGQIPL